MGITASTGGEGVRGTAIRPRSATGVGGRAIGRVRLETADFRARRAAGLAAAGLTRRRLALVAVAWEADPFRLVLKWLFMSLEALESPEVVLFTAFVGLILRVGGFTGPTPSGTPPPSIRGAKHVLPGVPPPAVHPSPEAPGTRDTLGHCDTEQARARSMDVPTSSARKVWPAPIEPAGILAHQ